MDLVGIIVLENRRKMKFTVLTNPKGFDQGTINALISGLFTEVSQLPAKPDHLIILGETYTAKQLEPYLQPGTTVEAVVGYDNPRLPFRPLL